MPMVQDLQRLQGELDGMREARDYRESQAVPSAPASGSGDELPVHPGQQSGDLEAHVLPVAEDVRPDPAPAGQLEGSPDPLPVGVGNPDRHLGAGPPPPVSGGEDHDPPAVTLESGECVPLPDVAFTRDFEHPGGPLSVWARLSNWSLLFDLPLSLSGLACAGLGARKIGSYVAALMGGFQWKPVHYGPMVDMVSTTPHTARMVTRTLGEWHDLGAVSMHRLTRFFLHWVPWPRLERKLILPSLWGAGAMLAIGALCLTPLALRMWGPAWITYKVVGPVPNPVPSGLADPRADCMSQVQSKHDPRIMEAVIETEVRAPLGLPIAPVVVNRTVVNYCEESLVQCNTIKQCNLMSDEKTTTERMYFAATHTQTVRVDRYLAANTPVVQGSVWMGLGLWKAWRYQYRHVLAQTPNLSPPR